jgi:hypothetical protein
MAEISVNRIASQMVPIIEDPNPFQNRIFINSKGYESNTLSGLWNKEFHYTLGDQFKLLTNDVQNGFIVLEKGSVNCWGNNDTQYFDMTAFDAYHHTLDYEFFPCKSSWRTINNRILFAYRAEAIDAGQFYNNGTDAGSNLNLTEVSNAGYWVSVNDDITNQAQIASEVAFSTHNGISMFCYEDITNQTIYGINAEHSFYECPIFIQFPDAGNATPRQGIIQSHGGIGNYHCKFFFIGVDNAGWTYWCKVFDNAGSSAYAYPSGWLRNSYGITKVNPTTWAVTVIDSNITPTRGQVAGQSTTLRTYPSNILRTTTNRRIFYSSQFDANNVLQPIRFTFDTAVGNVWSNNCIMSYPVGNSYNTYSSVHTTTGTPAGIDTSFSISGPSVPNATFGFNRNSWHYKPLVFNFAGQNYITFWLVDKSAAFGQGSTRWNSDAKRTMLTFSIGSGTGNGTGSDLELTYHSKYTFPSVFEIPRNFLPLNTAKNLVAVPVVGSLNFFSFNPSTGWSITGNYPIEFRSIGLDSQNRLWGQSLEKGYGVVHLLTPTIPVNLTITMAAQNYSYTGSNVQTTAAVAAYDTAGNRIATVINLVIDGTTMVFTSSNTRLVQITTSVSNDITVPLTITGGGVNQIVANINI